MSVAREIGDYAGSLFDVVGASRLPLGEALLIVGLESTPERNLDEFSRPNGVFWPIGFERHIGPGLDSIVSLIRSSGFFAEPAGRWGYPPRGTINLKVEAIRAGLGAGGKSTVVLHPKYGPRLRFAAIRTDAPLDPLMKPPLTEEENPLCSDCNICIDACPVRALEPYRMPDPARCLSTIPLMPEEHGRLMPCDICLHLCPAGKQG